MPLCRLPQGRHHEMQSRTRYALLRPSYPSSTSVRQRWHSADVITRMMIAVALLRTEPRSITEYHNFADCRHPLSSQIFARHPVAADMLLDILSDRGFSGAYIVNERIVPARINPDTWKVENEIDLIHKFRCVS